MRIEQEWLTPVRMSGMAAYLVATAACWFAALGVWARGFPRRLAALLGLFYSVLLLDIAFGWRWKLYDLLKSEAVAHDVYDLRHGPQIGFLLVLAVLFLIAIFYFGRKQSFGVAIALGGVLVAAGCWCVEVISLHVVDSILYHKVGPWMVVNFVWFLAALLTVCGLMVRPRTV